jgi:hypothetical protein
MDGSPVRCVLSIHLRTHNVLELIGLKVSCSSLVLRSPVRRVVRGRDCLVPKGDHLKPAVLDLDNPFSQSVSVSSTVSPSNFPRVQSAVDDECKHVYVSVRMRLSRLRFQLVDVGIHKFPTIA